LRRSSYRKTALCWRSAAFALANNTWALQAYLGHKNIQHTVRYTELSLDRFKDF
jgi:type 1 fimbriae regulatory protein FimB/type 1 fimbriae regulatory protein FimE